MHSEKYMKQRMKHHHHHHLLLNREGRWGITDDFAISFLHFSPVLHCPLGLNELQACPLPDVVFPPLLLSALISFRCPFNIFLVTLVEEHMYPSKDTDTC